MEGAKESNKAGASQWGKPQTRECSFRKAGLGKDSTQAHTCTHTRAVSSHRPLVTVP